MQRSILLGTLAFLVLAGCSAKQPTAESSSSPNAVASSSPASSTTTKMDEKSTTKSTAGAGAEDAQANFAGLHSVVKQTQAAVKTGDFAQAKTEFAKFEEFWSKVEDGVKAKASKTYDAIEESSDGINGELKAAKPDKAKLDSTLKTLDQAVTTAEKP